MANSARTKKRRKFAGHVCYFCGSAEPSENEDIPGKQFGVNAQTGGLLVPVCRACNKSWSTDQEFVRLRIVLNAGSNSGAEYIKERELTRLRGSAKREPQTRRYLGQRAKQFFLQGTEYLGLTDCDLAQFSNVLRHWAAGIHYSKRNTRPALPGSVHFQVLQPNFFKRVSLSPDAHGRWAAKSGGEFGLWWFLPGPTDAESITIFNVLRKDELRFAVRFPAIKKKSGT